MCNFNSNRNFFLVTLPFENTADMTVLWISGDFGVEIPHSKDMVILNIFPSTSKYRKSLQGWKIINIHQISAEFLRFMANERQDPVCGQ